MSDYTPPSPTQFNAALERIERGLATVEDADLIRRYVAEMEEVINYYASCLADARELLRLERASSDRYQRALNEALNSGSGAYIP
ncbi:hypothetical protein ACPP3B_12040 [Tepidimonas sp. HKU77]|jgi:hypothetical protein|uniref:hypothetical protein n=1 Tax=Tepidimonas sp. HKU77 TaxID=3414503 RepID=UPI003C7B9DDC